MLRYATTSIWMPRCWPLRVHSPRLIPPSWHEAPALLICFHSESSCSPMKVLLLHFLSSRGESGWCSDVTSTHGAWRHAGVRFLLSGVFCTRPITSTPYRSCLFQSSPSPRRAHLPLIPSECALKFQPRSLNEKCEHQWSSGRIHRCHRCDPGSIPG